MRCWWMNSPNKNTHTHSTTHTKAKKLWINHVPSVARQNKVKKNFWINDERDGLWIGEWLKQIYCCSSWNKYDWDSWDSEICIEPNFTISSYIYEGFIWLHLHSSMCVCASTFPSDATHFNHPVLYIRPKNSSVEWKFLTAATTTRVRIPNRNFKIIIHIRKVARVKLPGHGEDEKSKFNTRYYDVVYVTIDFHRKQCLPFHHMVWHGAQFLCNTSQRQVTGV